MPQKKGTITPRSSLRAYLRYLVEMGTKGEALFAQDVGFRCLKIRYCAHADVVFLRAQLQWQLCIYYKKLESVDVHLGLHMFLNFTLSQLKGKRYFTHFLNATCYYYPLAIPYYPL